MAVYLGDGNGNFTQIRIATTSARRRRASARMPRCRAGSTARLRAPSDNKLDLLITLTNSNENSSPYTVSLLNQTNPPPVKPAPITSTTTVQASPMTGNSRDTDYADRICLRDRPTGSVTFTANGSTVGTAALTNGTATLPVSFANVGSYAIGHRTRETATILQAVLPRSTSP